MIWTEPIILVFSFYLVLLYFVLFTFLNGYPYIFTRVYGITTSMTYIIWSAMMPGIFVAIALIPYIYSLTKKAAAKAGRRGPTLTARGVPVLGNGGRFNPDPYLTVLGGVDLLCK